MDITGMTSEVDGMMSATRSINTVMASRLVITNVMRSPDSGGRQNAVTVKTKMENAQCKKCLCQRTARFYHHSIFFPFHWPKSHHMTCK